MLLPGDPARALALAQDLLDQPRMSNHSRGLWGYTGETLEGHLLGIQATGIGGPSLAIVLEELARLGARRFVRIGTCRSLEPSLRAGSMGVVGAALADEGASRALGAEGEVTPDRALTAALGLAAREAVSAPAEAPRFLVASSDLYYDPDAAGRRHDWLAAGAAAVDLGTATLFALGSRLGLEVACLLVVWEDPAGTRLGDDDLGRAATTLGRIAVGALSATAGVPAAQAERAPGPPRGS
jgi:uridine phosphorylase